MTDITICRYCGRGIACINHIWVHMYTNDHRCDSVATPSEP